MLCMCIMYVIYVSGVCVCGIYVLHMCPVCVAYMLCFWFVSVYCGMCMQCVCLCVLYMWYVFLWYVSVCVVCSVRGM